MSPEAGHDDRAIRSSIDELAGTAETARSEVGDLAGSLLTALDELTRTTTAALPGNEASALEAELRHIADGVRATTDVLENDVVAAIETETAELERLLRADANMAFPADPRGNDEVDKGNDKVQRPVADEPAAESTDGDLKPSLTMPMRSTT